jgi:hypothetical protein
VNDFLHEIYEAGHQASVDINASDSWKCAWLAMARGCAGGIHAASLRDGSALSHSENMLKRHT